MEVILNYGKRRFRESGSAFSFAAARERREKASGVRCGAHTRERERLFLCVFAEDAGKVSGLRSVGEGAFAGMGFERRCGGDVGNVKLKRKN